MILTRGFAEAISTPIDSNTNTITLRSTQSPDWFMATVTEWCDDNDLIIDSMAWERGENPDEWAITLRWDDGRAVDAAEIAELKLGMPVPVELLTQQTTATTAFLKE